jgi:hypothetical protein
MSKHIFEELPTRKHAPAAAPAAAAKGGEKGKQKGGTEENSEKRVRQAVYDIRYRARREGIDLKAAYSQYMANSSLNQAEKTAVKAKLFGKKEGGMSEQYSVGGDDLAVNSVAGALFKVFVEETQKEEKIELAYEKELDEEMQERKYKVRVTDPKSEKSYVRYATREKITQLRAKGLKVEMTEYGEPYEGERKKREGGKKRLDPVGREDKDVDNDGDHDKNDKYILNRRKAIGKAIAMRKEDYLWNEGTTSTEGQNAQKIDVMKKGEVNNVKVFPQDGSDTQANGRIIQAGNEMEGPFLTEKAVSKSQQRFFGMVRAKQKGEMKNASPEVEKAAKSMKKGDVKKYAETKHDKLPEKKEMKEEAACPKCGKSPCECDTRANKTYRDLLKNKLRSMGKKVMAAGGDEESLEKSYDDMMTASFIKTNKETGKLEPVHVFKEASPTGYNKGERYTGKAGAMSDEEVKRANEGSAERIRKSIFKKA